MNDICPECGHHISDHDEYGVCQVTSAGCGYGQCEWARKQRAAQQSVQPDEGDEYDFTNADQNPWILSHEEADALAALRR